MRHSLRITVVLLVAGLVLLAAGCGGSKSSAPTTKGTTGHVGVTGNHPGTTGKTGAAGSFASAKNCLAFAGLAAKIASAMAVSGHQSSIENGTRYLQALADAAPSDIKGDIQTVAAAFSSYVQALKDSGYDPSSLKRPTAAQIAVLATAARVFATAKLQAATQHLSLWEQQNCK